uniref:DNA alkylation repair enzyme n=1 Tax=Globisporangium ultimum (strain ATCC 200006 / CBS 805.95 / DAOM BR144) TaxID=431595 RepID=K3WSR1_GLOUD
MVADARYALGAARFFKTDYCKHDVFIGVRVPQCRTIVRAHLGVTPKAEITALLQDPRHELRVAGGICLVEAYEAPHKCNAWFPVENKVEKRDAQQQVVEFYLEHLSCFNNWDLVDLTSYKILGAWMLQRHDDAIRQFCARMGESSSSSNTSSKMTSYVIDVKRQKELLADAMQVLPLWYQGILQSSDFWETRVSIVLCLGIRKEHVDFVIHICKWHILRLQADGGNLYEQHINGELFSDYDLVHKACGWVLRECGKTDRAKLLVFLETYAPITPRTTLQYATEHLSRALAKSFVTQGPPAKKQRITEAKLE